MSTRLATAELAAETTEPEGGTPFLTPELSAELEDLSPEEQSLVAWIVRRGKFDPRGERVSLADVWLVNQFLKMDPDRDDASVFQNIAAFTAPPVIKEYPDRNRVDLPTDLLPLSHPLGEILKKRASRRDYSKGPLSLRELASVLEGSYGVRTRALAYNVKGFPQRFVPSTGGLQPVEVYLFVNAVEELEKGLYHYNAAASCLEILDRGNFRRKVVQSCVHQDWLDAASVVMVLTCDMRKLYWKYGRRGYRFAHVDVGILAQTLHLAATSLGIRSCMVAGYNDDQMADVLQIDGRDEFVGLVLALGRKPWEPSAPAAPAAPAAKAAKPPGSKAGGETEGAPGR